ncbi:MAG: hypothetical protein ACK452_04080 [Bacteroidota bacterium]|jgi:hypothetical protein
MNKSELEIEKKKMKEEFPLLFKIEKHQSFSVPDGYFENSEMSWLRLNNFQFDHSNRLNFFNVPESYFENNSSLIYPRLNNQEVNSNPFVFGPEYFSENHEKLKTSILLHEYRDVTIYETPDNFFELSQKDILDKIDSEKIVRLAITKKKKYFYLGAACLAAAIFISVFVLLQEKSSDLKLNEFHMSWIESNPDDFDLDEDLIYECYLADTKNDFVVSKDSMHDQIIELRGLDLDDFVEQ